MTNHNRKTTKERERKREGRERGKLTGRER